jgi:putative DNA primase/helicase
VRQPAWLDNEVHPPAADLIACGNGLLYLPTRELLDHHPAFFNLNAVPFNHDPSAPEPLEWLEFLNQLWPDDPQAIDTLQEIFGLLLTGDTRHQKAFLVVGPKRSGKGTIARIMTALLGQENVCGPTLSSLAQNFGLAPLIGKCAAIISDARISGKADQSVIVERMLSITGEDSLTIDRKFRERLDRTPRNQIYHVDERAAPPG